MGVRTITNGTRFVRCTPKRRKRLRGGLNSGSVNSVPGILGCLSLLRGISREISLYGYWTRNWLEEALSSSQNWFDPAAKCAFSVLLTVFLLRRFHLLKEFDEGKRSCRRRLAGHNERRRKPHPETHSLFGMGNPYLHREISTSAMGGAPFYFPGEYRIQHPVNN